MYCLCISNVSVMYWQCICKVCLTPLFSSQYVLEMYLIGLFQCIGHVFTMQYIPIHHRGTGMYYRMYWDVFTDVLGCIWWGILGHIWLGIHPNTADNTSQYIVEYIIIPLKYIPIHLWCIEMLIHPKTIWYIHNTSQYIPIHRVHPPRFANATPKLSTAFHA